MKIATFQVNKALCGDCSLAIKRFIEGIDGVDAVNLGNSAITIRFDESAINEGTIRWIAKDNIERLGYRIEE
jgi:copper chaperone CopZ